MQPKILSALIASACFYSANGIADTSFDDMGVVFPNLPPDYTISRFSYAPDSTTGMTKIAITVLNNGKDHSVSQRPRLLLKVTTGTSITDANNVVLFNEHFTVPIGSFSSRTLSWNTPSDQISKNIFAYVDPEKDIAESNENNNEATAIRIEEDTEPYVELESTISFDVNDGYGIVEDTIGVYASTVSESEIEELLSGVIVVKDESGETLDFSGSIPLTSGVSENSFETNYSWDTPGVEAATYTVIFSVWGEVSGKMDEVSRRITLGSLADNNRPIATDDIASTIMNETVEIDVQGNDVEPDGNGFIHYISSGPEHGSVEMLRGVATYTPVDGFVGTDQFGYQMNDYSGASDWAKVSIDILPPEHGCTWIRDFEVVTSTEKTAIDGWSDFALPETGRAENAAFVQGNSNPELFDVQPFISFPSCSLYFQAKPGVTGTATVVYKILDKATEGDEYTSETRSFDITLAPETAAPTFVSTPNTLAQVNEPYSYLLEVSGDDTTLTALELPDFLTLDNGEISGTPHLEDVVAGMYKIVLVVDNGIQSARQEFLLTVEPGIATIEPNPPGPLSDDVNIDAITPEAPSGSASAESESDTETGVVQTGGSGGFNPFWLLLSLPLLRRLR